MIRPKAALSRLDPLSYERLRQQILRRDGWRCQSCRAMSNLEVHHREFRSHSGAGSEENLITLCTHATPQCTAAKTISGLHGCVVPCRAAASLWSHDGKQVGPGAKLVSQASDDEHIRLQTYIARQSGPSQATRLWYRS